MRKIMAGICMAVISVAVAAEEGTSNLKIAVVNISRVFNEYKKTERVNQQMKEKFEEPRQKLQQKRQELLKRSRELRSDPRPDDDPELVKERQQLGLDNILLQKEFEKVQQELAEFNLRHTAEIMQEIEVAVSRLASKRGYDLVLKHQPPQEQARSNMELMQQVGANPVLYFVASIDITDTVVQLLNTAYDRGLSLVERERTVKEE